MMRHVVIDTNVYAAAAAQQPEVVAKLRTFGRLHLPLNVIAELRYGFLGGTRREANELQLLQFLQSPHVGVLMPDEATTFIYAELAVTLKRRGRAMPHNDIWIAALTLQHHFELYSFDAHFDFLPELKRA